MLPHKNCVIAFYVHALLCIPKQRSLNSMGEMQSPAQRSAHLVGTAVTVSPMASSWLRISSG
jgi:hypothetical protein